MAKQIEHNQEYKTSEKFFLKKNQFLDLRRIRYSGEALLFSLLILANIVTFAPILIFSLTDIRIFIFNTSIILIGLGLFWLGQNFLYWHIYGNSVRITSTQYPDIYYAIENVCIFLDLKPRPKMFVYYGHGIFNLYLIKILQKRGVLIITSEVFEKLLEEKSFSQLLMLIGRQLGHIKCRHFKLWFLTDFIGQFTFFIYWAWKRRCHYTADRIGMLVAGDLETAQRALLSLTVGKKLSRETNIESLREQENIIRESWFAWLAQLFKQYPYMIYRIMALETFEDHLIKQKNHSHNKKNAIGYLPTNLILINDQYNQYNTMNKENDGTSQNNIVDGTNNTIKNNQKGNFGIGHMSGGEIKGNAKVAGVINEAEEQNLAEAAAEIQALLEQLSKTYPTTTSREKNIVVGEAVDQIESNSTLKYKVTNALKALGTEAFKEAVNHPLVNILVATIEGWQDL